MPRPKILLVDDSRLFLEMEKDFLRSCAVMIYTARDGQEALDVVRMVRPDLIFMDLYMPEMDGVTCCAALKADPDMQEIPVVMVVTTANDDDLLRCYRAGCNHVIAKPVDRASFLKAGHRFLPAIDKIETRVPVLTLVVFRLGKETFYGTSANLSSQGMFVAFDGKVEVEDVIHVSFILPDSGNEVVEASGRVAWLNTGNPLCKPALPKGFGVEFTHLGDDATRIIAAFISRTRQGSGEAVVEGAYLKESFF